MTDIVERLRNLFTGWKRIDDLSEEAAVEIERLRAVLLEARVILQTWVNVSDDMSADPLPKPLREIQDDEQALLIRAQEWCRRMGPVTPAEATRFRAAADEIERLRDLIERLRAESKHLRRGPLTTEQTDRLIDALAECIVARQGLPNRDRAKLVLAEIEAQGWRLVPPKENDA